MTNVTGSPLGASLRTRRADLGMKLPELSELTGLAVSYLSDLERLPDPNPTLKTIFKLCEALGCTVHELVPASYVIVVDK